eukprot:1045688-Rhodomonas_salina.1
MNRITAPANSSTAPINGSSTWPRSTPFHHPLVSSSVTRISSPFSIESSPSLVPRRMRQYGRGLTLRGRSVMWFVLSRVHPQRLEEDVVSTTRSTRIGR